MRVIALSGSQPRNYVFLLIFDNGGATTVKKVRWKYNRMSQKRSEYYTTEEDGSLKFVHSNDKTALLSKSNGNEV